MAKYQFNLIERQTLYEAYDKRCFYCGELAFFRELHIDHIVPENVLSNEAELKAYLEKCLLPETFLINSYSNWAPTHARCNQRKSGQPFEPAQAIFYLNLIAKKKEDLEKRERQITKKLEKDVLLASIAFSVSENKISQGEINMILNDPSIDLVTLKLPTEIEFINRIYRNWINSSDYNELLLLQVKTGSPDDDGLMLTSPDGKNEVCVKNCREYFEYIEREFYPRTTYDTALHSFFEKTCGLVSALKTATIPTTSYITDCGVSIANLELIPVSFLPFFGEKANIEEFISSNETLKDFADSGKINTLKQTSNSLSIEFETQGFLFIELLRADLNNDGIEDILLFVYTYVIGGSMKWSYTQKISRLSDKENFQIVR